MKIRKEILDQIVAHAVGLVVGEPEGAVLRVEVHADGVADAARVHLALRAVEGIHAHDAPDPDLVVEGQFLARRHVVRLAERDVEHSVLADAADARAVVVRLLIHRDQLALRHHLDHRHVGAFVEKLGRGKVQHAVVLDHDEETVLGPADAVGHVELERRCERLHLVRHAVAVAVSDGPETGFAGAYEQHVRGRGDGHVPCIRHHGVEGDLEAGRQLDVLEVVADGVRVGAGLRHRRNVQVGPRHLHLLQLLDVLCLAERRPCEAGSDCEDKNAAHLRDAGFHGFSPWESPAKSLRSQREE